jgi:hypothetical protein
MGARAIVQAALRDSNNPDPKEAVRYLMAKLSSDEKDIILEEVLRAYASQVSALSRGASLRPHGSGISKWDRLSELLNRREVVGDESKFLGDLTATDLEIIATSRYELAEKIARRGEAYSNLARTLKIRKKKIVRELSEEEIVTALAGDEEPKALAV